MSARPAYDAVVLAGGAARRMGGVDKLAADVGGRPVLDRVLLACAGAAGVVVVGPRRPTVVPVRWTREHPPGGGPAAGVAAALPYVESRWVALLAGDLPLLDAAAVQALLAAVTGELAGPHGRAPSGDGAAYRDGDGRVQWLGGVYRRTALAAAPLRPGGSLRAALGPLRLRLLPAPEHVTLDCDTAADLHRARELA